ncbi:hypothetical protein HZH68_010162 [Vespula germanica]|uniref:Uncharacterized protein n=1 Tax=Vespula germanica TaxID=30212 RepID=A0A834JR15_VESGE|nr:hypothetical protein HZH68_010162 [Vespula germanica]
MSEQGHRVRNGILLGMTLRPSASDAHIPPLSTTVRAFRISNNKTRSTVGPLIAPEHSHRTNFSNIIKNIQIMATTVVFQQNLSKLITDKGCKCTGTFYEIESSIYNVAANALQFDLGHS